MRRLVLALLLCAACGGPERKRWSGGDPELFGVLLVVEPDAAAYASEPGSRERLRRIFEESARYFGREPAELAGSRVVIREAPIECNPGLDAWGCQDPETNTVYVATRGIPCLEQVLFSHELLHYFIGDHNHTDPLWKHLRPLWDALNLYC